MKVAVLGSGAWGSALAVVSAKSGNDVLLWSYDGLVSDFDGVKDITITRYADVATAYSVWLIATPAEFFRETIRKFAPFYNNQTVIICTKGIEPKTHKFMSEILAEELPNCKNFGILSGPQFPAEAADGIPTSSTIRGNEIVIKAGTDALNKMELVPTDDIIGAQICGVGKNAVALLMGYMSVMAAGENERARILTKRGGEVAQFGINTKKSVVILLNHRQAKNSADHGAQVIKVYY